MRKGEGCMREGEGCMREGVHEEGGGVHKGGGGVEEEHECSCVHSEYIHACPDVHTFTLTLY